MWFLGGMRTKRGRNNVCFCGRGKKFKIVLQTYWGLNYVQSSRKRKIAPRNLSIVLYYIKP
jgi:hypothetical protein